MIEAAADLIADKSFADLSIEEITTKARVAKGTFYVHFKRKEDIFSALIAADFTDLNFSASHQQDLYSKISEFLKASAAVIEKHTLSVAQKWLRGAVDPLHGDSYGMQKWIYDTSTIEAWIQQEKDVGNWQKAISPKECAQMICASYYGMLTAWCLSSGEIDFMTQMDRYCQNELKSLLDG